jgi:hypothetical protein
MPGIHSVFRPRERGAPKEPRLPAGARALFLLSDVRVSFECFHGFTANRGEAWRAVDGWGSPGPICRQDPDFTRKTAGFCAGWRVLGLVLAKAASGRPQGTINGPIP